MNEKIYLKLHSAERSEQLTRHESTNVRNDTKLHLP